MIRASHRAGFFWRKGFTLMEVLVAMMILSISLTVVFQLFSGGLRAARMSEEYTMGVFKAREKMEEILLRDRYADGEFEGSMENGFRWRAKIYAVSEQEQKDVSVPKEFGLFKIHLDLEWDSAGNDKHIELDTLKYARRDIEKTEGQ